jgi:hypothetical protein
MAYEFRAYYFGFDSTGNEIIDNILQEICRAGKAYHNTGQWNKENEYSEDKRSYVERIQDAANIAAKALSESKGGQSTTNVANREDV